MNSEGSISARIEAVLFFKNEPVSRAELAEILSLSAEEIEAGIRELKQALEGRGTALVDDDRELELRVAPAYAPTIEALQKEGLSRDLGKAGLETLAILLYKGPSTKAEIEFIRGVNSSYVLRALSMRGLLRRIPNPKDERSFLYETTGELLAHLGVTERSALPEWESLQKTLADLTARKENPASDEPHTDDE